MADRPAARGVTVTVRYFAAARTAAGVPQESIEVEAPEPDVAAVLAQAVVRHGPGLANVLGRCSYLLDETAVHGTSAQVGDGAVLDVLPPFAGG